MGSSSFHALATFAVLGPLAALPLAACGGADDADTGPTPELFCEARAARECVVADACTVTLDACRAARRLACQQQVAAAVLDDRAFSPVRGADCLLAIDRAFREGKVDGRELDASLPGSMAQVCASMFVGRRGLEEPCASDGQCAAPLICAQAGDARVCAEARVFEGGEPCGNPGDTCAAGFFCNRASRLPRCEARRREGESCSPAAPCEEALLCDGTCQPRRGVGEPCQSRDDCSAAAPYCDPYAGNVCGPALIFTGASPVCLEFGKARGTVAR